MTKRPDFEEFKRIAFKDKNFVKEYELLRAEFENLQELIKRKKLKKNKNKKELS